MSLAVVILAAGKGTRMKSSLPKVMHAIGCEPMITHVVRTAMALAPEQVVVVTAPGMEVVEKTAQKTCPQVKFVHQAEQKGTGHAVQCAMAALTDFHGTVLVIYGDTPLLTHQSLRASVVLRDDANAAISLLGMKLENPTGYGRLLMNDMNKDAPCVTRIVEEKDATTEEKTIPWVWGGVMAFDADFLREGLAKLEPSPATGEYYLTALLEMAAQAKRPSLMLAVDEAEVQGVNSRAQLAQAEAALQQRLRGAAMEAGVTLIAPETVFLSADTVIGADTIIKPYTVIEPDVQIGAGCTIGPFARLRPGTRLADGVHIGNFVELKATQAEAGAKINHLSYVGDSTVGAAANIGAGVITCNYDGFAKHRTAIGAGAFIGSNASLVAPVAIGEGAIIGAGSVITRDVPADALALERSSETIKAGGAAAIRARKNS